VTAPNSLDALRVIDRLQVGPVILEPDRLVAPYTVTVGEQTDSTELVFKYEEPVFSAAEIASGSNLALVAAAQVALNYGLFCRQIVFVGPHDERDRRFLTEMARHTAREIYVIKLLRANPFLLDSLGPLPAERQEDFLGAELRFEGDAGEPPGAWEVAGARHAVLSSGGKDSLLTFGLLQEMGLETHPIYVNESGRHWYTALNAYRHFSRQVPNTSRVWTSADRVFTWMLRHLPFVRKDFAKVRADIYPIRLWTVAVFLFGALPLLRKRGVGRLLVGDEFDTTARHRRKGITHYGGLYDQSRYFDNALTRYFGRKRWGISQFSIIRSLSELLIQKVLVERYPELLRHQVSCHATHVDGERVRPCGRCEKCRRIIGMLVALGADPRVCGYTDQQIDHGLSDYFTKGVHLEPPCAEHVAHLLLGRGVVPGAAPAQVPSAHAEVLQLRFDDESAPLDSIPTDLRPSLYRVLLEHAGGAVRRSGKAWIAVDPLDAEALARPYRFEDAEGPR